MGVCCSQQAFQEYMSEGAASRTILYSILLHPPSYYPYAMTNPVLSSSPPLMSTMLRSDCSMMIKFVGCHRHRCKSLETGILKVPSSWQRPRDTEATPRRPGSRHPLIIASWLSGRWPFSENCKCQHYLPNSLSLTYKIYPLQEEDDVSFGPFLMKQRNHTRP